MLSAPPGHIAHRIGVNQPAAPTADELWAILMCSFNDALGIWIAVLGGTLAHSADMNGLANALAVLATRISDIINGKQPMAAEQQDLAAIFESRI
jgi:hypothetical protein